MYGFNEADNTLHIKECYQEDIQFFLQEAEVEWKGYDEPNKFVFELYDLLPWQIGRLAGLFPLTGEIKVVSFRDGLQPEFGWTDIYVDRKSPLGNPFLLRTEGDRSQVINAYHEWLMSTLRGEANLKEWGLTIAPSYKYPASTEVRAEFNRIKEILDSGYNIRLVCWCAPLPCHADIIKHLLETSQTTTKVVFTGNRSHKIKNKQLVLDQLTRLVDRAYQRAIELNYTEIEFISGCAPGVDTWAFDIVEERRQYWRIQTVNTIATPCGNFVHVWGEKHRPDYDRLLENADKRITVSTEKYTSPNQLHKRNEAMVGQMDGDDILIAIHDGKPGGTQNCINYAQRQGKAIALFNHLTGKFSKG